MVLAGFDSPPGHSGYQGGNHPELKGDSTMTNYQAPQFPTPPPVVEKHRNRPKGLWIRLAAAAVIVVAVGGVLVSNRSSSTPQTISIQGVATNDPRPHPQGQRGPRGAQAQGGQVAKLHPHHGSGDVHRPERRSASRGTALFHLSPREVASVKFSSVAEPVVRFGCEVAKRLKPLVALVKHLAKQGVRNLSTVWWDWWPTILQTLTYLLIAMFRDLFRAAAPRVRPDRQLPRALGA
jgi:hypothetical protein